MLLVLTGGARSGKSSLAVDLGHRSDTSVTFVATCPRIEGDRDLERRIDDHQAERPAQWQTIEVETNLAGALAAVPSEETLIVDCLTLWVSNLFYQGFDDNAIKASSAAATEAAIGRRGTTIVVTNEVGLGIVPADELSRRYRDMLGRVNQQWVAAADSALFMAAGRAMPLVEPERLLP